MFILTDFVQIIVAVFITWVVYAAAYLVMLRNEIVKDYTKPLNVPIIKGWVMTRSFTNRKFNTYNPIASNYIELPRSVNRFGGSQFSYTFWMRFDDLSQKNLASKVLFLLGDTSLYEMEKTVSGQKESLVDFVVKCPLVKFGPNGRDIIVEVNTMSDITERAVMPTVKSSNEVMRHNVFSLMPSKFVMWTIVFEDDKPVGGIHESGCVFRMYVNDFLYATHRFKGALRLNKGTLNILPLIGNDKPIESGYFADLTYYNRALTVMDVRKIFAMGVRNTRYDDLTSNAPFNEPLYITEYNKLDIYNW